MFRILGKLNPFSGHARVPSSGKWRRRVSLIPSLELLEEKLALTDVSGEWIGALTLQLAPIGVDTYSFTMDLHQTGNNVEGTDKIYVDPQQLNFVVFNLSGSVDNNNFAFQESSIKSGNPPTTTPNPFSLKSGNLQIQQDALGNFSMVGPWASATNSGAIEIILAFRFPPTQVATTTTVTSSANPSNYGQPVTFTATVAPATGTDTPTGTITFTVDGTAQPPVPLKVVGGKNQASLPPTATLSVGTHTVTAVYTSSDGNFAGSMGSLTKGQTVKAQVPVAPVSRLTLDSLVRTTSVNNTGIMITYTAKNFDLDAHVPITFYWASAPTYASRIGAPAYTLNDAQNGSEAFISRSALGKVPFGARYLLATVDNEGTIDTIAVQLFHALTVQDIEAVVNSSLDHKVPTIPPPVVIPPGKLTKQQQADLAKRRASYKIALATYNDFRLLTANIVAYLNSQDAFFNYQINYPERQAAFIGSILVETRYLETLTQNTQLFGNVGNLNNFDIGRGYLQITGKPNYISAVRFQFPSEANKQTVSKRALSTVEVLLATNPQVAAKLSGWYWNGGTHHSGNSFNSYADHRDWLTIGQIINIGHPAGSQMPKGENNREVDSNNALHIINAQLI